MTKWYNEVLEFLAKYWWFEVALFVASVGMHVEASLAILAVIGGIINLYLLVKNGVFWKAFLFFKVGGALTFGILPLVMVVQAGLRRGKNGDAENV